MSVPRLLKRLSLTQNTKRLVWSCALIVISVPTLSAQEKKDPSSTQQTSFAPGVVTVIPPAMEAKETFDGPLTLKAMLDAHPEIEWDATHFKDKSPHFDPRTRTLTEMAKQAILRREISCLEFSFKPLRQLYIDVRRPDGRMQRKLVWYMVYRVRYRGGDLRPAVDRIGDTPVFKRLEAVTYPSRRFFPLMIMSNHVSGKNYLDTILPSAKSKIKYREQISAPLYNSVEITRVKIPSSKDADAPGVWGLATWTDVDPKLDFVSVNVSGLSNAFQQDGEGEDAPFRRKTLKLNFYRPGDAASLTEDSIRFGIPAFEDQEQQDYVFKQYGLSERLDYQWTFQSVR